MKLVFATHNKNKFKEVKLLLPHTIELLSLTDIDCHEDIPETADTISGNAILKVEYVKDKYGLDCFADDTGLEVPALNNEPGVYSARYAGEPSDSEANMKKILENLEDKKDRSARFKTVIAYLLKVQMYYLKVFAREKSLHQNEVKKVLATTPFSSPKEKQKPSLRCL